MNKNKLKLYRNKRILLYSYSYLIETEVYTTVIKFSKITEHQLDILENIIQNNNYVKKGNFILCDHLDSLQQVDNHRILFKQNLTRIIQPHSRYKYLKFE